MLNVSNSIIFGVFSGVATSFIVWLLVKLFQNVVRPWYQALTYRGVKIGGDWSGFYKLESVKNFKDDPDYNIHINQKGHSINGELTRNKNSAGEKDLKTLSFEGFFRDGNLVIWYQPKEETRLGLGSYLMKLVSDGRMFEGRFLFISSHRGEIMESQMFWVRNIQP